MITPELRPHRQAPASCGLPFLVALASLIAGLELRASQDAVFHDDHERSERAIVTLVQQRTIVKRFEVKEAQTSGVLVRLKAEHLTERGEVIAEVLDELSRVTDVAVEFRNVPLTDRGLKSLVANVSPIGLDLAGSQITDTGLAELKHASRLRLLDLSFTRVTDAGLPSLSPLAELRHLSVLDCRITDAAVPSLVKLKTLRELYLSRQQLTASGRSRLQQELPTCRVVP